ncbi:MAG: Ku protein, partial [Longimicrobiales bacterium]
KQYLVLLTPVDDGIVMEQLRYSHEVRSFADVPIGSADVKEKELELAVQLIRQIATDEFKPDAYRDEVRERVLELIQRKIEGEDITEAPVEAPQTQIIDLMEALKASLARSESGSGEQESARKGAKSAASAKTGRRAPRKRAAGG